MKILLYTQETSFCGSPRLLLNLAQSLAQKHEVIISFPEKINPKGRPLFDYFSELKKIPKKQLIENDDSFDVGIFHLPYWSDKVEELPCRKKVAVIMEVVDKTPILINSDELQLFDKIIYLHDEQIQQFDVAKNKEKFIKLNIINNINYQPKFSQTGNIGSVGFLDKHNLKEHLNIIRATKNMNKQIIYGAYRPSAKEFGIVTYLLREIFYRLGKMEFRGTEVNVQNIYQSFDCLLHTPARGNGTSVVVSDALASGKYVVLSPLPKYKEAYSHLEGVFFLDEIGYDLTNLMQSYNHTVFQQIKANYCSVYDRNAILKEWESVLING